MSMASYVKAKSDQLNAVDVFGEVVCVIESVALTGAPDQPWAIKLSGFDQPWKPSLTCRRLIIECWGDSENGSEWVGRSIQIYKDPTVTYGGEATGGIRFNALSHMQSQVKVMLPFRRNKRKEHTVSVLQVQAMPEYPQADFDANVSKWVGLVQSGSQSTDSIINNISNRFTLTEQQKQTFIDACTQQADNNQPDI